MAPCDGGGGLGMHIYSSKVVRVLRWLSYLIYFLRFFSAVEHCYVRKIIRYENNWVKTLKVCMDTLTEKVEVNIWSVLSDKISLVFQCAYNSWHFLCGSVAVFASFRDIDHLEYRTIYMALSPVENEEAIDAASCASNFYPRVIK